MITLVEYQKQWYRAANTVMHYRNNALFNIIVEVEGNEYNIIKNRYSNKLSEGFITDLMRMQLWTEGKTYMDLPTFTDDNTILPGPLALGKDNEGNLVTILMVNEHDPRS